MDVLEFKSAGAALDLEVGTPCDSAVLTTTAQSCASIGWAVSEVGDALALVPAALTVSDEFPTYDPVALDDLLEIIVNRSNAGPRWSDAREIPRMNLGGLPQVGIDHVAVQVHPRHMVAGRKQGVRTRDVTGGTRRPIAIVRAPPTTPLAREKRHCPRTPGRSRPGRPSVAANQAGGWRLMSNETDIRPFRVGMPDEAVADLRLRVAATRWPSKELVADRSQGVQLATIQELARYWATD